MYHRIRVSLAGMLLLCLGACASGPEQAGGGEEVPRGPDTSQWPDPVGSVSLNAEAVAETALLDIGLVVFDAGIPEDESLHSRMGIFPEIRQAEARYLPVTLRQQLEDSGAWGVVRVLPQADASSELSLRGRIVHSDGLRLVLHIQAEDATGRVWLDRLYLDEAEQGDYPVAAGGDPYLDLYRQVANDLLAQRRQLDGSALREIRQVGQMRYAAGLSPEAFASYLAVNEAGRYQLLRLPAQGDPMQGRVQRIRNQEYQFIDHVDEQYMRLREDMFLSYALWRQEEREQALFLEEYEQRVEQREAVGRRGSFIRMQQVYTTYGRTKEREQDLRDLAKGLKNEVEPTVMEVGDKVFRLGGTLDSQYAEWREILREIFALEMGL